MHVPISLALFQLAIIDFTILINIVRVNWSFIIHHFSGRLSPVVLWTIFLPSRIALRIISQSWQSKHPRIHLLLFYLTLELIQISIIGIWTLIVIIGKVVMTGWFWPIILFVFGVYPTELMDERGRPGGGDEGILFVHNGLYSNSMLIYIVSIKC